MQQKAPITAGTVTGAHPEAKPEEGICGPLPFCSFSPEKAKGLKMENGREQRGLAIAAICKLKQERYGVWMVPSQTFVGKSYKVTYFREVGTCTCPDFEARQEHCKHIFAVELVIRRETNADGTTTVTHAIY